jgi:WD40 repeat protein
MSTEVTGTSSENSIIQQVLIGSDKGFIFIVDYQTTSLQGVFKCHSMPIRSIACTSAYVATGSDDCMLRVWPYDFQEFYVEAKHTASVKNIAISADGVQIIASTDSGSVGKLDVGTYEYKTLLKLHSTVITDIDSKCYKDNQLIASISSGDTSANANVNSKTVRVYTSHGLIHKLDSHSEFSGDEVPTSLSVS